MKIFYCGLQYDKYDQSRGESFEHENFYLTLANMDDVQVRYFPYDGILEKGKQQWNADLLHAVKEERPDLVLFFMLSDELDKKVLESMMSYTRTLAWFADDHWRFDNYSRHWAKHFSWVVTTYSKAVERYRRSGVKNVIRSQWAANPYVYTPSGVDSPPSKGELEGVVENDRPLPTSPARGGESGERPDVLFIGGWSKPRQKIIDALQKAGIEVEVHGGGWPARYLASSVRSGAAGKPNGRVSEEEMIRLFGTAKINLALNPAPGFLNKNTLGRLLFRRSVDSIVFDPHIVRNFKTIMHRGIAQIKARHFEIPACKGFTIAGHADDVENYYEPDKEMVFYKNTNDLINKIKLYLKRPEERDMIAQKGYERTVRDHTYEMRFREIFREVGIRG